MVGGAAQRQRIGKRERGEAELRILRHRIQHAIGANHVKRARDKVNHVGARDQPHLGIGGGKRRGVGPLTAAQHIHGVTAGRHERL